jgi:hypothetical protein
MVVVSYIQYENACINVCIYRCVKYSMCVFMYVYVYEEHLLACSEAEVEQFSDHRYFLIRFVSSCL